MFLSNISLIFNGEIYNYIELRDELCADGVVFRSASDTEVLLRMWERYGPRCLTRLRGMFAFIIFDPATMTTWAARDPFGIKPLYYAASQGTVALASEMRGVLASGLVSRRIDATAALACVAAGINKFGSTKTLYSDVHEVPPGSVIQISNGSISQRSYYQMPDPMQDVHDLSYIPVFREAVAESVRVHLRSSRTRATCLSGGLDSTNLLLLASETARVDGYSDLTAYTICTGSAFDSELSLANLVAARARTPHITTSVDTLVEFRDIVEMVVACESPNHKIGPINQFLLLRTIAESGATVVLDGQGGDELLSGYPWYWTVLIHEMRQRGTDIGRFLDDRRSRTSLDDNAIQWYDVGFHDASLWVAEMMRGLSFLGRSAAEVLALPETQYYLLGGGDWTSFRRREYFQGELPYLLRQEDRLGMWFGLECRVPYVDVPLVECAGRMSPELLIRDSFLKYPFRVMLPDLPEEVRWSIHKKGYWETSASRYPWLLSATRSLTLESAALRDIFPGLEAGLDYLSFDQAWRLLQLAVLERTGTRSGVADIVNSI